MKLVPIIAELEYATYENPRVTVEYEIVPDGYEREFSYPFALHQRLYELPDIPLIPLPEGVER